MINKVFSIVKVETGNVSKSQFVVCKQKTNVPFCPKKKITSEF